jgi:hypothetical protein
LISFPSDTALAIPREGAAPVLRKFPLSLYLPVCLLTSTFPLSFFLLARKEAGPEEELDKEEDTPRNKVEESNNRPPNKSLGGAEKTAAATETELFHKTKWWW